MRFGSEVAIRKNDHTVEYYDELKRLEIKGETKMKLFMTERRENVKNSEEAEIYPTCKHTYQSASFMDAGRRREILRSEKKYFISHSYRANQI